MLIWKQFRIISILRKIKNIGKGQLKIEVYHKDETVHNYPTFQK